jgi:hypothetical protein
MAGLIAVLFYFLPGRVRPWVPLSSAMLFPSLAGFLVAVNRRGFFLRAGQVNSRKAGPVGSWFDAIAFFIPRTPREAFRRDWIEDEHEMIAKGCGRLYRAAVLVSHLAWELGSVVKDVIVEIIVGLITPRL